MNFSIEESKESGLINQAVTRNAGNSKTFYSTKGSKNKEPGSSAFIYIELHRKSS